MSTVTVHHILHFESETCVNCNFLQGVTCIFHWTWFLCQYWTNLW